VSRLVLARGVLLAAVAAVAVLSWVVFGDRLNVSTIESAVHELGALATLVFVGAFALATVLFVPGSIFGLAGGLLFGPLWGAIWNLIGATLGATVAFLIARFIAGSWIAAKAHGRLEALLLGVAAEGWRFVALTRLVPIVPFNLLNYALGLTRIPLSQYLAATLVCMVPGAAAYAWLGHAGRAALAGDSAALGYGALGLAALAMIAFVPRLIRGIRAQSGFISAPELRRSLAGEPRPLIIDVREAEEFSGPLSHIPGALNIPLGELPSRMADIKLPSGSRLVFVCRTDKRSAKAAAMFQEAKVLRGGVEAWNRL
jgi:uncharacterized membrane protein YdjX (TVP38/TMEM64 family)/rhodanese-related sulfurtransferase